MVQWSNCKSRGLCVFLWKRNENHALGTVFFIHQRIVPSVKKVEFVSDRISCIVLSDRWCNIIFLSAYASTEEKNDDSKDSFYEALLLVFYRFPKYHMKILLADF